jgi:putative lipoprotein
MSMNWKPLLTHVNALLLVLLPMLVSSHESAQAPPPTTAPNLSGTSWQLVKFQGGDERTLTPDDKTKYTLQFTADGRVAARVDCNRGSATWKASGNQLQLGPLALTRAACLSPVLHDRIVKDWEYVRSYIVKKGHLFLSLMADAGIYEFEPMAAAKQGASAAPLIQGTATYRERMALPPTAVFEATLEDVSPADAAADIIARTRLASPGNPPIRFEITYDPARIQTNRSYVARARIVDGERLMFTTDTSYPVLTGGKGNSVSLMMRRAPGTGATSPQGAAAPKIEGTVWRLTRLRGQPDQAVASLSRPATLQFDAGRIQAFGGCNRLVGSYTINGDRVTIGQLAGTMMACAQPVMAVETAFNKALTGTLRIRLAANGLTLTAESESDPTLVFVAEPVK